MWLLALEVDWLNFISLGIDSVRLLLLITGWDGFEVLVGCVEEKICVFFDVMNVGAVDGFFVLKLWEIAAVDW